MKNVQIQDGSGDKKYFTIIPNYVLNHSTLYDREVYIQMKRITGEEGTCWTSQTTLAKQCGMSLSRLRKALHYLLEHGWIEQIGKKDVTTKGGKQQINEYRVTDLWKLNVTHYEEKQGGVLGTDPDTKGGVPDEPKGVSQNAQGGVLGTAKEYPMNNNQRKEDIPAEPEEVFDFLQYWRQLRTGNNRLNQIIAIYWDYKDFDFSTRQQAGAALKREFRAAKSLEHYSDDKLIMVMDWLLDNADFKWTLETVHKYVDEDLSKIKFKGKMYAAH